MMKLARTAVVAALALTLGAQTAFADAASEAYVRENANKALVLLNNPELTSDQRRERFNLLMDEFTDLEIVSNFVIGKYSRRFDAQTLAAYRKAFKAYALAVYQAQLDNYRGNQITVTGSIDRSPTDSIVLSRVERSGSMLDVEWRVLKRGNAYQVVDVALDIEGNLVWLGIEQRAQFIDLLDRSNGNANALIRRIEQMTAKLKREAAERG